jgi:hypothetical protein
MDEWERLCLPAVADAPVRARVAVGSSLRARACAAPLVGAAQELVHEAVSAVVQVAGDVDGPDRLWVRWGQRGRLVRLEVHDPGRLGGDPGPHDRRVAFGAGAGLVEQLADDWGSEPVEHGRLLWCELRLRGCRGGRQLATT